MVLLQCHLTEPMSVPLHEKVNVSSYVDWYAVLRMSKTVRSKTTQHHEEAFSHNVIVGQRLLIILAIIFIMY